MLTLMIFATIALGFSFLCSIAEAVLLSATPSHMALLEQEGKQSGKLLRELKEDLGRPLSAILSLNTIANTVGAAGVGMQSAEVFGKGSLGVVSGILTFLILVFSEIIPKTLGAFYWRGLLPMVTEWIRILIWIMIPFVWLSKGLTKLLTLGRTEKIVSREELSAIATLGATEGLLEKRESRILKNLFEFSTILVKDIMTPRMVTFSLKEDMTIGKVFEKNPEITFSRIPVFKENLDEIDGFVLKNDILLAQARDQHEKTILDFKRKILSVPETASMSHLFKMLLARHEHILLVVNEYGGFQGIVTQEDLVETLLGLEIVDEDDKAIDMRALARAEWEKRAKDLGILPKEKDA